jgi:hypothetical protein
MRVVMAQPHEGGWPVHPHEAERCRLVDTLQQRRATERQLRLRVRRDANIAAVLVAVAGVGAMWNTAGPEDFDGNAAAALRVNFWILYLLIVGAVAVAARALGIAIRHRSLRDARAATATSTNQLNAWNAANHYRTNQSRGDPPHDTPTIHDGQTDCSVQQHLT